MEIFQELDAHLLNDPKPSNYINELSQTGIFEEKFPYTLLGDLKKTPQSPKYHPEGNVWNHTLLVLDNAAERKHLSQNPQVLMWSALLHDLGKAPTTRIRKGKITSYDHDQVGEGLAVQFLKQMTQDDLFIHHVSKMVRWHMQILFVVKGLPFADLPQMAKEVPVEEIAILGFCDRLGRGEMTQAKKEDEAKSIEIFLEKCNSYLKDNKTSLF